MTVPGSGAVVDQALINPRDGPQAGSASDEAELDRLAHCRHVRHIHLASISPLIIHPNCISISLSFFIVSLKKKLLFFHIYSAGAPTSSVSYNFGGENAVISG